MIRRPFRATALLSLLPLLLTVALATGCGYDEPEEDREVIKPTTAPQPSTAPAPAPAPRAGAPTGAPAGATGGGQLDFELPEGWQEEPPDNTMRIAQARVSGEAGDAELAVFWFGPGGGGGVEANIQRWVNQVQPEAGTEPERETFETDGLTVHTVAAEGTVTPSPMSMQGGTQEPQPGQMLLGAVVEGPGGPWFFKMTGPAETVEPEREAFFEMVRNASVG